MHLTIITVLYTISTAQFHSAPHLLLWGNIFCEGVWTLNGPIPGSELAQIILPLHLTLNIRAGLIINVLKEEPIVGKAMPTV